jgi:uncharacterized membrane protein
MKKVTCIASLIAAATLPTMVLADPTPAPVPKYSYEKCYGVAAKGENDCAAGTHSCAGTATKDKDGASFVYLPSGTCKKISGASTSAKS